MWLALPLMVVVIDQAAKALVRRSPPDTGGRSGWRPAAAPRLHRVGPVRAVVIWMLSLLTFGAIGLAVGVPPWAAVGGISAWGAAGSNLYEFVVRGGVTDHLPVMPHTRGNLADIAIVAGAAMFLAGLTV